MENILAERIEQLHKENQVLVLRTCGSVYQQKLVKKLTAACKFIDLSLPQVRMRTEQDMNAFVRNLPLPIFLANLQYVPEILPCLLQYDVLLGKVLASSSQTYYLQEAAGEHQDKVCFVDLPLAESEGSELFVPADNFLQALANKPVQDDFLVNIIQGKLCGEKDRDTYFAAYVRQVLQRDIMELTTTSDDMRFYRFLCAVAAMTGNVVNYAVLANVAGITAPTAKQWLKFLAGTGVVYMLQPLEHISMKRLVKAPKLYFRDTGLVAYLLQLHDVNALVQSVYFKSLFENYVVNTIRESYLAAGEQAELCFYRDSNNKEISLVLRWEDVLYPISITKETFSVRKTQKTFRVLAGYAEETGAVLGNGCVIAMGCDSKQVDEDLWQLNGTVL